ncbi:hypothetical protein R4I72_18080 [Leclercia adecarboxylata]|uniref:hypothetical protein n=1 Tax=Leclercia adecarboxylata TaxID=83655 RepID=UPI0027C8C86B|nr:hypothetical protein [Leclercia adecarboxylata]MDQ2130638.1 hypothetical protein [Leclercia adecarboxylata]MDV7058944.1 hypothetical protein [Leclercia adecarboxylata]
MYSDKTIKLVVLLNKLTVQKSLEWTVFDAPKSLTEGTEDKIQIIFHTNYKEKDFVIYNRKFRHYIDEYEWSWTEGIVLAIVTPDFKPIWEMYEQTQALRDLFNSVSKQASGFDDFVDELLNM